MDKNISKLIAGLKFLIIRRELNLIDDSLFLRLFSKKLDSFNNSRKSLSEPFLKVISCDQNLQLNELVECAADFWEMIPSHVQESLSYNDYYRIGFIDAVLRVMDIFGIDEKCVKK